MPDRRIVIIGNAGSGKTTMARALRDRHGLAHLDLDAVAWAAPGERAPLGDSVEALRAFHRAHPAWVVEGSYGSLVEAALPLCTELRFLDPGVEACLANCRRRPWEPEKYPSPEAQDAALDFLLGWVRQYPVRGDEYGRAAHLALYDRFGGPKRRYGAAGAEDERRR